MVLGMFLTGTRGSAPVYQNVLQLEHVELRIMYVRITNCVHTNILACIHT